MRGDESAAVVGLIELGGEESAGGWVGLTVRWEETKWLEGRADCEVGGDKSASHEHWFKKPHDWLS